MKPDGKAFEEHIAGALMESGGYRAVKVGNASGDFDAKRGLDAAELFAFVRATQGEAWERLSKLHGGESRAWDAFVNRLAKELDARGTVDVLRHGVVDLGVRVRLAYFKPAHGLTPELVARYEANRLTIARQLPYDPGTNKTLDLALFVNGVPVATAELKNALTGQGVEDAKEQYRADRDPRNVTLGRRAIVHFAVDTEQVAKTTRLEGASTRFLPFNRGHGGGKGNPPNPRGHRTAYLWETVWGRMPGSICWDVSSTSRSRRRGRRCPRPWSSRATTNGTRCSRSPRTPASTARARATSSSTRRAPASPTRQPGSPTESPACTAATTKRSSTRSSSSPTGSCSTSSCRTRSTSSSTPTASSRR